MELPLLQRREIEARILAPVIESLMERFGREEVLGVVREAIEAIAQAHGSQLAERLGSRAMEKLPEVLELWKQDGALEADELHRDDGHFDFNVTRCRFAEMYERLGIRELGSILSCNRDFCFAKGFNPDMELTRTQTIMEGASHCDFRFRLSTRGGDARPTEDSA